MEKEFQEPKKFKRLKRYQKVLFLLTSFLLTTLIPIFGAEIQEQELSYDYKQWLAIPENERKDILPPNKYTVTYNEDSTVKNGAESTLNGEYDDEYILPYVRISNQKNSGLCWAFTSNLVLETSVQKILHQEEQYLRNYSESHLDFSESNTMMSDTQVNPYGFNRERHSGGTFKMALAYWLRGMGPKLESQYQQFDVIYSLDELYDGYVDESVEGSRYFYTLYTRHNSDGTVDYSPSAEFSQIYTQTGITNIRNDMKQHIMENGAIFAGMYWDDSCYYEPTASYLSKNNYNGTHAVTIVGWDDDYGVENFPENNRPTAPGAWIVANSWGVEWGINGYFYVSYEDSRISADMYGITGIEELYYDTVYTIDHLGAVTNINAGTEELWAANVFSAGEEDNQYLSAVTFYVGNDFATCEIWADVESNYGDANTLKHLGTMTDVPYGYNTFKLETPIKIEGNKIAVAVNIKTVDGNYARIGAETIDEYDSHTYNAIITQGVSYIGPSLEEMEDAATISIPSNVSVKARTVHLSDEEEYIETEARIHYLYTEDPYGTLYDETSILTNKNIIAEISFNKDNIEITNNNGSTRREFAENGQFTFTYIDEAGVEGSITATVTGIDKENPEVIIIPNGGKYENGEEIDVTITANDDNFLSMFYYLKEGDEPLTQDEELEMYDNYTDQETIDLTISGEDTIYKLYIICCDEAGNQTESVTNTYIFAPYQIEVPTIQYNITTTTTSPVTATLVFESDNITITNNGGSNTYTFTKDGEFTFEYQDDRGNQETATAMVNWIAPLNLNNNYELKIVERTQYIKKILVGTTVEQFIENIARDNTTYAVKDSFDNSIAQTSAIATTMKLQADGKQYKLVVIGDINGDGRITSTDVSQLILHIIEDTELIGEHLLAADMNNTDTITLTDLSRLKAELIK